MIKYENIWLTTHNFSFFYFPSNLAAFLLYHISNPSKLQNLSYLIGSSVCFGCPPLSWHWPFCSSSFGIAGRNNLKKDRVTLSHTYRRFQTIVDGKTGREGQFVVVGACSRGFSHGGGTGSTSKSENRPS